MKKKFSEEQLICPYCERPFLYNIASFKAKVECPHCQTDLLVRTRHSLMMGIIGIPLFFMIKKGFEITGISQLGPLIELPGLIIVGLGFVFLISKGLVKIKGAEKVYAVDCEDPTILERKKKRK